MGGFVVTISVTVAPVAKRRGFDPWVGKIPWRRKWQPTPVFLAGESQGQRSLVGYSPWGCKELDMTEQLNFPRYRKRKHKVVKVVNYQLCEKEWNKRKVFA